MAESRRLLIDETRLIVSDRSDKTLSLQKNELHYLKRVLRLREGDPIEIVDGAGNLWGAILSNESKIKLISSFSNPKEHQERSRPLLSVAVVLPKRGFDELVRMTSELGVDVIQILHSKRSTLHKDTESRMARWKGIVREAVEQSERLWMPDLRPSLEISDWLRNRPENSAFAFATTRKNNLQNLQEWREMLKGDFDQIWVIIGPEGGWTKDEEDLAFSLGCVPVKLSNSILRTSTAAISALNTLSLFK